MIALRKLTSIALMAMPLATSASSIFGTIGSLGSKYGAATSFDAVGGLSCIYDINKYSTTKSYTLLKALYGDIHNMINSQVFPRHEDYAQKFNANVIHANSSLKDIYLALYNAQYFVPADLYVKYVEALCKPNCEGILECYKLLSQVFCRRYKKEAYLRCVIDAACHRISKGDDCKVTHIGFFNIRNVGADYFLISRNGRLRRTNQHIEKCHCVLYLPRECLMLHCWMKFSLEFDAFILEQLKCFFNCNGVYRHWMSLYCKYTQICAWNGEGDYDRCSIMYVNLKIFSFFIIASVMPEYASNHMLTKMHTCLEELFCDNSCKFTEFISVCLSIFSK